MTRSIFLPALLAWSLIACRREVKIEEACGLDLARHLHGSSLRATLRAQASPTDLLSYGAARDSLYLRVESRDGWIEGLYSGERIHLGKLGSPRSDLYDQGMSAEHVWPQSFGAGASPQRSDLHNVFPAMEYINQARGNSRFAEIPDSEVERWYGPEGRLEAAPVAGLEHYSKAVQNNFEPREAVKGDVARAVFYFATIWESEADWSFLDGQLQTLLHWHRLDPPDKAEEMRTLSIKRLQGNCNPFVAVPILAERAFP